MKEWRISKINIYFRTMFFMNDFKTLSMLKNQQFTQQSASQQHAQNDAYCPITSMTCATVQLMLKILHKYCKLYDTRSRMPYRLPIPRTNCRKRMFFYNALQLWNNISDNEFVYFTDLKKFRSNYFDCIMRKFTLDSFKTDRIF